MSLRVRKIANSMTSAVNENVNATILVSDGVTINDYGIQEQSFTSHKLEIQLQSMESDDLEHFGFANQQGKFMMAYANGMVDVLDRDDNTGSSIVETRPYGSDVISTWQVMKIAESYNDWVKFIIRYTGKKDAT